MKKFLAVFDGYNFSDSTLQYAVQLAKQAKAHLVGVFLDEFIYRSYSLYNILKNAEHPFDEINKLDQEDSSKRDAAVTIFQKACKEAKLTFFSSQGQEYCIAGIEARKSFC